MFLQNSAIPQSTAFSLGPDETIWAVAVEQRETHRGHSAARVSSARVVEGTVLPAAPALSANSVLAPVKHTIVINNGLALLVICSFCLRRGMGCPPLVTVPICWLFSTLIDSAYNQLVSLPSDPLCPAPVVPVNPPQTRSGSQALLIFLPSLISKRIPRLLQLCFSWWLWPRGLALLFCRRTVLASSQCSRRSKHQTYRPNRDVFKLCCHRDITYG